MSLPRPPRALPWSGRVAAPAAKKVAAGTTGEASLRCQDPQHLELEMFVPKHLHVIEAGRLVYGEGEPRALVRDEPIPLPRGDLRGEVSDLVEQGRDLGQLHGLDPPDEVLLPLGMDALGLHLVLRYGALRIEDPDVELEVGRGDPAERVVLDARQRRLAPGQVLHERPIGHELPVVVGHPALVEGAEQLDRHLLQLLLDRSGDGDALAERTGHRRRDFGVHQVDHLGADLGVRPRHVTSVVRRVEGDYPADALHPGERGALLEELPDQEPSAAMPDEGERRDRVEVLCFVHELREGRPGARVRLGEPRPVLVPGRDGEILLHEEVPPVLVVELEGIGMTDLVEAGVRRGVCLPDPLGVGRVAEVEGATRQAGDVGHRRRRPPPGASAVAVPVEEEDRWSGCAPEVDLPPGQRLARPGAPDEGGPG